MRNFQFKLAQIAPRGAKRDALALVLTLNDLPGDGWSVIDAIAWRTGAIGAPGPEAKRAATIGSISALRSFEQRSPHRWLFAEAIPFVTPEDANAALPQLKDKFIANPRAKVDLVEEGWREDVQLSSRFRMLAFEQRTSGPTGEGMARYAFGTASSTGWCTDPVNMTGAHRHQPMETRACQVHRCRCPNARRSPSL